MRPARNRIYWGDVEQGAWTAERAPDGTRGVETVIRVRDVATPPCAVASKSHRDPATGAWLDAAGIDDCVSVGSSLKFVLVASGEADVYPRTGPTMEWDTAAGDAVLRAAGGRTLDLDNQPFRYGKPDFRNTGFVATGPYERGAAARVPGTGLGQGRQPGEYHPHQIGLPPWHR